MVTTRRALVLSVLLLVTAGLASQIPKIQVDPSVENLISSFEEGEGETVSERFHADFGDTDRVMLVLVEADEGVLAREPLQYLDEVVQEQADHIAELEEELSDVEVVHKEFGAACYIGDSLPVVLYLTFKCTPSAAAYFSCLSPGG